MTPSTVEEQIETTKTFAAFDDRGKRASRVGPRLAVALVVLAVLLLDLVTPGGVSVPTLYVFAVIGSARLAPRGSTFAVAGLCTVLILGVAFLEPMGSSDDAVANKLIAVAVLWVAAQLSFRGALDREASERLSTLVESSDDAIIAQTMDGVITSWNQGAERLFGYQEPEVVGKPVTVLFPDDRLDEEEGILARLRRGERVEHFETVRRRKDGTNVHVSLTVSPVRGRGGRLYGASKIARDITERVEAEERLARLADELAREKRALRRSNEDLERFAYAASHDLQEPLRSIRSFADLLTRRHGEALTGEAREFLGFITRGTARMQKMIEGLLALSRVETATRSFERVDLGELTRDVIAGLTGRIVETEGEITVTGELPAVRGDADQLGQLLQNLIDNALKYGGKAPRVDVRATEAPDGTVVSVSDRGPGIASELQENVFDAFRRLHTDDEVEGTGMGLAIAKKIVERHRGTMWLESKPGKGSTFFFRIP